MHQAKPITVGDAVRHLSLDQTKSSRREVNVERKRDPDAVLSHDREAGRVDQSKPVQLRAIEPGPGCFEFGRLATHYLETSDGAQRRSPAQGKIATAFPIEVRGGLEHHRHRHVEPCGGTIQRPPGRDGALVESIAYHTAMAIHAPLSTNVFSPARARLVECSSMVHRRS